MPAEPERLQKVMARAGVASRRKCEELIAAGRVRVNGALITEMGVRVRPGLDRIEVDGVVLPLASAPAYYVLYKPVGYLSTVSDPHGGLFAADLAPQDTRLYPVGRLDRDSEGLLLLTNDGELALRLTHPRYGHTKEYRVLIRGDLSDQQAERLADGMALEGKARPARAVVKRLGEGWAWRGEPQPPGTRWLGLVLREGHKRQIREMLRALGVTVLRLIRVRMASLALGDLQPGQGRYLTDAEAADLRRLAGLAETEADSEAGA
jgi:23S rRNA pseudouridine2605 synthase